MVVASACGTNKNSKSENEENVDRFPIEIDGKFGFIDHSGSVIITPQFDEVEIFF